MTHLYEASDRLAICGHDVLLICVHYAVALCPAQVVLGQVQVDLIAIKVGVEGRAICVVHADDALTLHHMANLDIKQSSNEQDADLAGLSVSCRGLGCQHIDGHISMHCN